MKKKWRRKKRGIEKKREIKVALPRPPTRSEPMREVWKEKTAEDETLPANDSPVDTRQLGCPRRRCPRFTATLYCIEYANRFCIQLVNMYTDYA